MLHDKSLELVWFTSCTKFALAAQMYSIKQNNKEIMLFPETIFARETG